MMRTIKRILLIMLAAILLISAGLPDNEVKKPKKRVYKLDIKEDIMPVTWRKVHKAFDEANSWNADLILIHMNTYGGYVDAADSIRTRILNCKIPVYVFIDNNAASAGALISIACDRIYMRSGANIGAATVVTETGEQAPDKYQAYMRSTMRSTAEAHGADTVINGVDTVITWKRDPRIAEAMVDDRCYIEGIIDSGKVITFTTTEAIKYGYCEGEVESISELFELIGYEEYETTEYSPSILDNAVGWLMNPILQGVLIMIIVSGIYFELQTPGIGFPLFAAGVAAILYFAPLYLDGIAEYWEILFFIIGIILLAVEIFAIPGFGFVGIAGIVLMVTGLTLSMLNNLAFDFEMVSFEDAFRSMGMVVLSMVASFIVSIWMGKKLLTNSRLNVLVLNATQQNEDGFVGVEAAPRALIGQVALTSTVLRPSGRVTLSGEVYDAQALEGFIEKGEEVLIMRYEHGQLYVRKRR